MQNGKKIITLSLLCAIALLWFTCGKKGEEGISPEVLSLSGSAQVIRNGDKVVLEEGFTLQTNDQLEIGEGASLSVTLAGQRILYFNQKSKALIEFEYEKKSRDLTVSVVLQSGELFLEYLSSTGLQVSTAFSTPNLSVVGKEASFSLSYFAKQKISLVRILEGETSLFPRDHKGMDIGECKKVLVKNGGYVSAAISITQDDFDGLTQWVGTRNIESLASASGCLVAESPVAAVEEEEEEEKDLPPVWQTKPKRQCEPGKQYIVQLAAKDPEGSSVKYYLLKGPRGMNVSKTGGVVHYVPKRPGTFKVYITAEDESGNSSGLHYYLTVIGDLNAVIEVPATTRVDKSVVINGARSVNELGRAAGLSYRFDVDGNGTWDYPQTGAFDSQAKVKHTYTKAGEYTVTLQVKNDKGQTALASSTVTVTAPPKIDIVASPEFGTIGTVYTFTISQPEKEIAQTGRLRLRWDLNGDKRWDYPDDGTYTGEVQVKNMWDVAGTFTVAAEILDEDNNRMLFTKKIEVYPGITIKKIIAPDTVNVSEKVTATCEAEDKVFAITEYAWDFAGVGMFEKKSKDPSTTYAYKEAGVYTMVCAVTNEKGMSASESKDIVVVDAKTEIDAGGPYSANVNVPFNVQGVAKDKDNKILSYHWDFDGDKKYEWSSTKTAQAKHTYAKKGNYIVTFGVKKDDGTMAKDTALVTVGNNPPKAIAGDDVVSRKKKRVKLNGRGEDPDGNIVKYEWDFNGDGTYDWSAKDTAYTEYQFLEYSRAVLKVTDSEGAFDTDTLVVVICPKGMATVKEEAFCIDKYEWPNDKGELPLRSVTVDEARAACEKAGKRLCTVKEMQAACLGNEKRYAFPYGRKYEPDKCNTFGNRHTDNQVAKSGEFPECVSGYDVYDMSGNLAEWTSTTKGNQHYVVGGWWQDDGKRARCDSHILLNGKKKYMYVGFRCCK